MQKNIFFRNNISGLFTFLVSGNIKGSYILFPLVPITRNNMDWLNVNLNLPKTLVIHDMAWNDNKIRSKLLAIRFKNGPETEDYPEGDWSFILWNLFICIYLEFNTIGGHLFGLNSLSNWHWHPNEIPTFLKFEINKFQTTKIRLVIFNGQNQHKYHKFFNWKIDYLLLAVNRKSWQLVRTTIMFHIFSPVPPEQRKYFPSHYLNYVGLHNQY